jgi:hypothetical protein
MTKNLSYLHSKIKHLTLIFIWFIACCFGWIVPKILAANVNVTASIPDLVAPSVPILIAPVDGAVLSDSTPLFQWYEATDNLSLSHYLFYLDGNSSYGNIPLTATENSQYILTYDGINGIYSLVPKNALTDANHTWRVTAVDYANLSSSSDTWDFRIDTLTPNFVLTQIGDVSTNISAANPSSVPDSPIFIFQNDATANEPILLATGEANSTVKLTVTIPGDATQIFTTAIGSGGFYELKLGILPRDTDIRLDFVVTDAVGHVSVLEGVYFRIALQYWPTPTPTSTPMVSLTTTPKPTTSVTPKPTISGGPTIPGEVSVTLTPTLTPTATPTATPSGIIPIIPPREIIHEGVDEVIGILPSETAATIRAFLTSSLWKSLSLWFALFLLLLFYIIGWLLLVSKFVSSLSWIMLKRVSALLFPHINPPTEHLVYEYRLSQPSPLAKIELLDENDQVIDVQISNRFGNFAPFTTDYLRRWRLRVVDPNFYYPISDEPPAIVQFWQFYQGQLFDHEHYHHQAVLIPTLRAAGQEHLPWLERWRIAYLYLLEYPLWWAVTLILVSMVFALRYPSGWNYFALGFCVCMWLWKLLVQRRLKFSLLVQARLGEQLFTGNLIVSLSANNPPTARALVLPVTLAQSQPFHHDFATAELTIMSRGLQVRYQQQPVLNQKVVFTGKNQQIDLQISKN